jgi:hypothetical protein
MAIDPTRPPEQQESRLTALVWTLIAAAMGMGGVAIIVVDVLEPAFVAEWWEGTLVILLASRLIPPRTLEAVARLLPWYRGNGKAE